MRIALVANPAAGGMLDPAALAGALERHGVIVVQTVAVDELETLRPGAERLVAAGGDGTVGPCAELAARFDIPLAVIPGGTANDFVRSLGLPRDIEAATELAATGTLTRRLELGRVDERPFVNVASAGLAVVAARRAVPLKRALGPVAYAAGAFTAGFTGRPLRSEIRVDGEPFFSGGAWQIVVACTGAFGGGSSVDRARPDDGKLDVTIVPAGARLALARRAWGLRRGTIADQSKVVHTTGEVVELGLPDDAELNVDGELCPGGSVRCTVEPSAYSVVVG